LKQLREGIRQKCPDKWKNNIQFLHHDLPARTSLSVRQFLTSKNITVIPHPPFAWPQPLQLFPIPQDEITAQKASFWRNWGDPCRIGRGYWHTHIWELPEMYDIMGNTLELLCTCPRGLLRRRQWKLGVTVINFFYGLIPRSFG
jgi:hypothetical protein